LDFLDISEEENSTTTQDETDLSRMPFLIQQQLRILMRPKKQRTEQETLNLVPMLQQVKFFRERNISNEVL
jgi:hypothetical protein